MQGCGERATRQRRNCRNPLTYLNALSLPLDKQLCEGLSMRYVFALFTILLSLALFTADIMAQTTAPVLSGRALGHQDRDECIAQSKQQNVARQKRAEFIVKCVGDRQSARKAQQKNKNCAQEVWRLSYSNGWINHVLHCQLEQSGALSRTPSRGTLRLRNSMAV